MKMHGETAILVPSHVTMTGIEKMLEIIHSLPKTQRKQENDYTYRASIKVNNIPVIIYYFELSHLSLSEREGFILDTIKEVLENKDL